MNSSPSPKDPAPPEYTQEHTTDQSDWEVAPIAHAMKRRNEGGKAAAATLLALFIHAAIIALLLFVAITITQPPPPEITASLGLPSLSPSSDPNRRTVVQPQVSRSAPVESAATSLVVSTNASSISIPNVPLAQSQSVSLGTSLTSSITIGARAAAGVTSPFGRLGGRGLPGTFYDMKQDPDRKPRPFSGGFTDYVENLDKIALRNFSEASLKGYYAAKTKISLNYLLIPGDTPAKLAPKVFKVEKEVEPRGWFIHYSGIVTPPEYGAWRFVGFFDDCLMVYVNDRPVLDGSWVRMSGGGKGRYDEKLRQEFGGPVLSEGGSRTAYAGKWIDIKGRVKIDIVAGESPGGLVGGLLMVQKKDATYDLRPDGTPILPLFVAAPLDQADQDRLKNDPFAKRYEFPAKMPVWQVAPAARDAMR